MRQNNFFPEKLTDIKSLGLIQKYGIDLKNPIEEMPLDVVKQRLAPQKQNKEGKFFGHLFCAVTATGGAHIWRVLLNRSVKYSSARTPMEMLRLIMQIIRESGPYYRKGVGENLCRGGGNMTFQAFFNELGKTHSPSLGVLFAGLGGVPGAMIFETLLIRKTVLSKQPRFTIPFTLELFLLYFLREALFGAVVFAPKEHFLIQYGTLLAAGVITAGCQKLIVVGATRDALPSNFITFDFRRDGFLTTLRFMMNGNKYTDPAFQVLYKNPMTFGKKVANAFYLCGPHVIGFRLAYLMVFSGMYQLALQVKPVVAASLFSHTKPTVTAYPTHFLSQPKKNFLSSSEDQIKRNSL